MHYWVNKHALDWNTYPRVMIWLLNKVYVTSIAVSMGHSLSQDFESGCPKLVS